MRARSRSPATSSPHHEYTGGSIIQGTPVTRREQTASGRAAGHHQHDRISEKGKNLGEKVSKSMLVPPNLVVLVVVLIIVITVKVIDVLSLIEVLVVVLVIILEVLAVILVQ